VIEQLYDLRDAAVERLPHSLQIELSRLSRLSYEWSPRRWAKKWTQRARRGYSTEDTFDFDSYLARVIAGGVTEIRETLHGYPPELGQIGETFDPNNMDDERGVAEWKAILDKIIHGFTIYAEEGGYPLQSTAEAKEKIELIDEAKALFIKWFGHLWD
jgi:hypothetical protein